MNTIRLVVFFSFFLILLAGCIIKDSEQSNGNNNSNDADNTNFEHEAGEIEVEPTDENTPPSLPDETSEDNGEDPDDGPPPLPSLPE